MLFTPSPLSPLLWTAERSNLPSYFCPLCPHRHWHCTVKSNVTQHHILNIFIFLNTNKAILLKLQFEKISWASKPPPTFFRCSWVSTISQCYLYFSQDLGMGEGLEYTEPKRVCDTSLDSLNAVYNSLSLPLFPKLPSAFLRFDIWEV
uniref:Uncharacterized protein n=1 Tax=Molossus molossus TaxID=27622 RepID=A0A7J8CZB1_MOLMO|nr:hypothetical protein HJG59_009498 [Molossus molossus]